MKKIALIILPVIAIIAVTILLIGRTPTKDGEALIFKTDENKVSVSEYYELLSSYYDDNYIYQRFEKDLLSHLEKSETALASAKQNAEAMQTQFNESQDPEAQRANVTMTLTSLGYSGLDDLEAYFANYGARTEYVQRYVFENLTTIFDEYQSQFKPRYVSHILFKVEDLKNVSEAEKNTMNNIKSRIQNGEAFEDLAKEFSEDGSKEAGGALGLMDSNTEFVKPFLDAALALETGELSEWVESEYGFHLIVVDTSNKETLMKDSYLINNIINSMASVDKEAMKQLIDETTIVFQDEAIRETIYKVLETGGVN